MAAILETSLGDITVDLYTDERPTCSKNFLKLCKIKYYNFCLFHSVQRNLGAQSGDPTGTGRGGGSVFEKLYGEQARFFEAEVKPRIKHKKKGTLSMVNNGSGLHGSQFFITTGEDLDYLDGVHTVFGEVSEGFETLDKINEAYCDKDNRPYQDIRIFHTVVLDDPYDDPEGLAAFIPDRSPQPTKKQLESGRIRFDEDIDDFKGKSHEEIEEIIAEREAKANAQLLEMVGDLPDVDVKPPDTVLFVCKLNPVTSDEDLEVIFSRFGTIISCEVIKDQKSGESLQYAFIEFEKPEECEAAYFKMDNVLIDDRRIHVDFSQSVSKVKWNGKGKGVQYQKQNKNDEEERPDYIIKDRSRTSGGYDLVFSDGEAESKTKKQKKKKKKKKVSSESEDSEKEHKNKRRKSRSPTDKKKKHRRERSRSHSNDRDHYRRDKNRDRDSRRDYRDRDSRRDRDEHRDRDYREDRDRHRYKERHRDRS